MFSIDQEKIINELKQQGYSRFTVQYWNDEVKQSFTEFLRPAGFREYTFHKIKHEKQDYIIVLRNIESPHPYAYALEEIYPDRNLLLMLLPLTMAVLVLAFTAILSHGSKNLMLGSIVFGIPIVLGALSEYFFILREPQSSSYKFPMFQPLVLVAVLIFAVIVLKEGVICLVMISPLIFICLLIGAAMMRLICRFIWQPSAKIYSVAMLPLLLWLVLPDMKQTQYGQTQRSVIIHAPAEQVFHAISHIGKIQPQEVKSSPIFWMGFPKPIFGMTEQRDNNLVRTIQWERGVKFEEVVHAHHVPYVLSWTYKFDKNSFPKGSVDDHIEMGGQYFDLLKTDYQLERIDGKTTKLVLTIDYRLSTEYNWYSRLWVNYILGEFSDVVMNIHKQRLE